MSAVILPRPLVLKLLHLAQQGPGSGFISQVDGGFKIGATDAAPFAFYRITSRATPEAGDIARCRNVTSLLLGVSVGVKGVLELRGWQIGGHGIEPVELMLAGEEHIPT